MSDFCSIFYAHTQPLNYICLYVQDERLENTTLREQNDKYKQAVRVLQNRLANAGLQTNVTLSQDEPASSILGLEAVDSLVRENLSLKDELKYISIDPSKMDETLKVCALWYF